MNYLEKNNRSVNAVNFLERIYSSGGISLTKVGLLRSLQCENGRVEFDQIEKSKSPLLTIEETIQIEKLIKDSLQDFVSNSANFSAPDSAQYY